MITKLKTIYIATILVKKAQLFISDCSHINEYVSSQCSHVNLFYLKLAKRKQYYLMFKQFKFYLLLITSTASGLFTGTALAANNFFCGYNNHYINLGNSMEQVTAACGQPSKIVNNIDIQQSQIWIYTPTQFVSSNNSIGPPGSSNSINPYNNSIYQQRFPNNSNSYWNNNRQNIGNMTVTITDNKVSAMQVNDGSTCYGWLPQKGSSPAELLNHCGKPRYIRKIDDSISSNQQIVDWTYKSSYGSPLNLRFKNNILIKIN